MLCSVSSGWTSNKGAFVNIRRVVSGSFILIWMFFFYTSLPRFCSHLFDFWLPTKNKRTTERYRCKLYLCFSYNHSVVGGQILSLLPSMCECGEVNRCGLVHRCFRLDEQHLQGMKVPWQDSIIRTRNRAPELNWQTPDSNGHSPPIPRIVRAYNQQVNIYIYTGDLGFWCVCAFSHTSYTPRLQTRVTWCTSWVLSIYRFETTSLKQLMSISILKDWFLNYHPSPPS